MQATNNDNGDADVIEKNIMKMSSEEKNFIFFMSSFIHCVVHVKMMKK